MKITCQSCQAKYTIADEKVLGKIVKIRCKKCGSTIVVNGNDPAAASSTESVPPEAPRSSAEVAPAATEGWTVNVAENDQRTMSDAEVIASFRTGTIDGDTFLWKDGMDDWAALRDLQTLYSACTSAAAALASSSSPEAPQRPGAGRMTAPLAGAGGNGAGGAFLSPAQSAARRGGGRAPAADLFGGVAQAGGEEDVLTSAPSKMPQAHDDPRKEPIGARNENSVFFSISAVGSKGASDRPPPPSATNTSEASGLIDIRQLSAQLMVEEKKSSRVDDIMNLSGGGAFIPNLAAPSLSAPSVEEYGTGGGALSRAPGRNKGLIFLAVGAGAFLIVAVIGAATLLTHGKTGDLAAGDKDKTSASAGSAESASPGASAAASAAPAASDTAATVASAEPSATAKAPPATDAPKENKPTASAPVAAAPQREAPPPRAAAVESDQPFNMGEAKARLGATAGGASGCKKPGGPTGTGRVVVVFAPSGATQSASVTGEPFEGTPTGACVASKFRAVRVPPFSGSPFSVSKSFTIN